MKFRCNNHYTECSSLRQDPSVQLFAVEKGSITFLDLCHNHVLNPLV